MATPIIKIPIDASEFNKFKGAFDDYLAKIKSQSSAWSGMNELFSKIVGTSSEFTETINAQIEATKLLGEEEEKAQKKREDIEKKRKKQDEEAAKARKKSLDSLKSNIKETIGAISGLGKLVLGGGALGIIGSALGGFGLYDFFKSAGTDRTQASSFGVSVGTKQAITTQFGRYGIGDNNIDSIVNAKADPSKWYAFTQLGLNRNEDNNSLVWDTLAKARELFKRVGGNSQLYEAYGGTALGVSLEQARSMAHDSDKDFNANMRAGKAWAGPLDAAGRKWQNFIASVDQAKLRIETVFVNNLGNQVAPALTQFADVVGRTIAKELNKIDWSAVGDGIKWFADYLDSPKFQQDLKNFYQGCKDFADKIKLIVNAISSVVQWFIDKQKQLGIVSKDAAIGAVFGPGGAVIGAAVGAYQAYMGSGNSVDPKTIGNNVGNSGNRIFDPKQIRDREAQAQAIMKATGLSYNASRIASFESGGDFSAKNADGTAYGIGQFTHDTWISYYRKMTGDKSSGDEAIWGKRFDHGLQIKMLQYAINDYDQQLQKNGLAVTGGNEYMLHFMGSAALQFLKKDRNKSALRALTEIIGEDKAQHWVDINPGYLRNKSVGQVIDEMFQRVDGNKQPQRRQQTNVVIQNQTGSNISQSTTNATR